MAPREDYNRRHQQELESGGMTWELTHLLDGPLLSLVQIDAILIQLRSEIKSMIEYSAIPILLAEQLLERVENLLRDVNAVPESVTTIEAPVIVDTFTRELQALLSDQIDAVTEGSEGELFSRVYFQDIQKSVGNEEGGLEVVTAAEHAFFFSEGVIQIPEATKITFCWSAEARSLIVVLPGGIRLSCPGVAFPKNGLLVFAQGAEWTA